MQQGKRAQWVERLAAWERSGLSQTAWCREHGVPLARFGYWRRRLSGAVGATAVLPIRVAPAPMPAALEARLPNGVVLRLPLSDPAALLPWLRALGAC